jgi:SAM-dependent methyltransferase
VSRYVLSEALAGTPDPAAPVHLHFDDGTRHRQDVGRWIADADPVDARVLDRCTAPTLDLGCGPGRLVAALARRGIPALGVDISAQAVALTRARGAAAIRRDLFDRLPGEGRWNHGLLIDGNIGIGGDPARLLHRLAAVLAPGGQVLVEVAAEDLDHRGWVRLARQDGTLSHPFPWAVLGAPALSRAAADTGWRVGEQWRDGGRAFTALLRRGR